MGIRMSHGSFVPTITITKGMRLQAARKHAGITQERMAEMLGCGRRTITRWESEDSAPPAVVMAYSVATDANLSWLQTGTPDFDNDGEFVDAAVSPIQEVLDTANAAQTSERHLRVLPHLDSNQKPAGFEPVKSRVVPLFRENKADHSQIAA